MIKRPPAHHPVTQRNLWSACLQPCTPRPRSAGHSERLRSAQDPRLPEPSALAARVARPPSRRPPRLTSFQPTPSTARPIFGSVAFYFPDGELIRDEIRPSSSSSSELVVVLPAQATARPPTVRHTCILPPVGVYSVFIYSSRTKAPPWTRLARVWRVPFASWNFHHIIYIN